MRHRLPRAGHNPGMAGPIDLAHFEAATFGDRALQREVLGLFDAQAAKLMQVIHTADGKARAEAAHALKGAARGIGAFALAAEAERVERGDDSAIERLAACVTETTRAAALLCAKD